jgi:hypothetical protein
MYDEKEESTLFVYDFKTEKRVKIFKKDSGAAFWHPSSKIFFTPSFENPRTDNQFYVTSIVTFN